MTKLPVAAGVALALVAGSAFAADLPSRKAPPVYIPPPPSFTWSGLYGGVNVGYGFGNSDIDVGSYGYGPFLGGLLARPQGGAWALRNDLSGIIGGGQIGYNWQYANWLVLGVEADIQASDVRSRNQGVVGAQRWDVFPPPLGTHAAFVNNNKIVDWYGTVRGRVGVPLFNSHLLVYGTGGFAYGSVDHNNNVVDVFSFGPFSHAVFGNSLYANTKTGWAAGGGFEWAPTSFPNWSIRAEYLYVDLGQTVTTPLGIVQSGIFGAGGFVPGFAAAQTSETRFHTVRAGLNYRWNLFSAPVVARY